MADPPVAYVVHETPDRLRLKVPEKRHNANFFLDASRLLAERLPGAQVETNAATASILIRSANSSDVCKLLRTGAPIRLIDREDGPPLQFEELLTQARSVNDRLFQLTGGKADARSYIILALVLSGLIQLARGKVSAPAVTLFWYAGEALRSWATASDRAARSAGERPG
jgi:hypothetical protein